MKQAKRQSKSTCTPPPACTHMQMSSVCASTTSTALYAGIMAASAPPPNLSSGWVDSQSSDNTNGLELGMSGMSLLPSFGGGLDDTASNSQHSQRKNFDSGDSVHSQRSSTASPLNTSNSISSGQGSYKQGMNRPPGLGLSVPSPIGKPGHAYGSSVSTAQTMTLTPTSSLDGGSEPFGMGRQSSPFHGDGPSMSSDYSRRGKEEGAELPPGFASSLGSSFDTEDSDHHDGLHGLSALRERSHSSPGPINVPAYSSSPPVVRNKIGSFQDDPRINPEQRRPRAVSRDGGRPQQSSRPPLSGSSALSPHGETNSLHADRNLAGVSMPFGNNRSRDPSPPKGGGFVSRPDMRYPPYGDSSEPRRRSISTDTGNEYMGSYGNQAERHLSMDQLTNKFGALPSLNSHVNQQRMNAQSFQPGQQGQADAFHRHQHQRSSSMPGPVRGVGGHMEQYPEEMYHGRGGDYGSGGRYPPGVDKDYHIEHQQQDIRYSTHHSQQQQEQQHRSMSMQHGGYHDGSSQAHNLQRRSSLQALPSSGSGYYAQNLPRRESLDFVPGHSHYSDSSEEGRMYSNDNDRGGNFPRHGRYVSPQQSPLHIAYGSHSRPPSDMGSSMSSSPMSLGSGAMRGVPHDMYGSSSRGSHHHVPVDDDLAHPLVGEHIEVPADDDPYLMNEGVQSHSHMRSSMGHGHSGSVDQMPSHYGGMETARHLPTAGATLPTPKNVYNVKFKKTQRSFVMGPRLNRDLKIGTYVKVEADRGEDLGIVVGKVASEKYHNMSGRGALRGGMGEMGIMPPPSGLSGAGAADLKRIIRLATHDEVALLQMKRDEEEELLKICRTKVRQRGLPMNVVDAEYQFDRHKLTFFFEAEGRVDFRELVRDLFSMYKTRIWMQQLDKSTSATCPTGAAPTSPVVIDYGTPIIAPESEFSEFAAMNATSGDVDTE